MTEAHAPAMNAFWKIPEAWQQLDFISDLHLSPDLPRTLATFRHYLENTPADALIILGDFFEVWVGDDARMQGFEAGVVDWLHAFSQRRALAFMVGNRDFLVGPDMARACGMRLLPDPATVNAWGQRLLLTHGDAWCLSDEPYQAFRAMVRGPRWQQGFLSKPLTERQEFARRLRQGSQMHQAQRSEAEWHDLDPSTMLEHLSQTGCSTLIHGHTHRPGSQALSAHVTRHILSDWNMDDPDHPRAEVFQWRPDGFCRQALFAPPSSDLLELTPLTVA